ncbi:MAG: arginine--tRNA ligase [Candidatus Woesearchaeota archaeon]
MDFKQELVKLLSKELKWKEEDFNNLILVPPDPKLGDFAFPCFKVGGNPKEAAEKLKVKLKLPKFIERVEVAGPYLNFFLNKAVWAEETLTKIKKEKKKYGQGTENQNMVVEFCSPNTNKPLHLGHVRNMSLGDAMAKILDFQGNKVHPVEIVNDRGVHICKSMLAYERWGNKKQPDKKTDHFVGDYYVIFAQKAKDLPGLEEEAQQMLVQWEQGNQKVLTLWKKMNTWVLNGFKETYQRFGIKFEKEYFESQFYLHGKEIAQEGLQKGIFEKDETGAVMVDLEQYGLGKKAVLRADGTSIYFTQDLYLAELRQQDFKFDKLMYVVASEQNLHFRQLIKVLELLGRTYAKNLYHLSYGMVNLPTGKMKSREGTVVDADDIMDELSTLAAGEVRKRHENLSEKEIKQRGEFIALGALKFYMLKTDAVRDMIFNPEESLSFEGETGPYVQYTHARSCSLLRKAKEENQKKSGKINFTLLNTKEELAVIKLLYEFPETLIKAAEQYKPHILCNHLIFLSQAFNEFYHAHQVISEDKDLMQTRLLLVDAVRQVLENGLRLLGIHAPEEM